MLQVKTPEEVWELIEREFVPLDETEDAPLSEAAGRVLAQDVTAREYVPDFDRSTVDGYALRSSDSFGCSEAIPAILPLAGEVLMGQDAPEALPKGACVYVPTGGAAPKGADCVVMLEYTENYGDGTVGVMKAGTPGMNMIFRGDDVRPGKQMLRAGRVLTASDIGALAAIGETAIPVRRRPAVAVISTRDELVAPEVTPGPGQVRDVNSAMLTALLRSAGAVPVSYGIVKDDESILRQTVEAALAACDAVILSGGSSVGVKDAACRIIEGVGELLFHGIALKPGKPTILGRAGNKPLIGLPGHPVAAYSVMKLFVQPLLTRLAGREADSRFVTAELSESVGANHGRMQVTACRLERLEGRTLAHPIRSKSGLITLLAGADGYFTIDRDCEGLPKGAQIRVYVD